MDREEMDKIGISLVKLLEQDLNINEGRGLIFREFAGPKEQRDKSKFMRGKNAWSYYLSCCKAIQYGLDPNYEFSISSEEDDLGRFQIIIDRKTGLRYHIQISLQLKLFPYFEKLVSKRNKR